MNPKRNIFLSHSHTDKPFVHRLARELERAGFSCWLDEAELNVGDSIIDRVGEGIYDSDLIVAVISTNSVQSNWVQKELQIAMTREISGKQIRVLPIILNSCTGLIPYYLRDKVYEDFQDASSFEDSLHHLIRGIRRRLGSQEEEGRSAGSPDVGVLVHDQKGGFFGFRVARTMTLLGVFHACAGLVLLLMAINLQRSGWIHTSKGVGVAGGFVMMSGLLSVLASYCFHVSFDRDRRLLYEWERIGDTSFCFTKKWRERYRVGTSVFAHTGGMIFQASAMLLMITGLGLLLVVWVVDIISRR